MKDIMKNKQKYYKAVRMNRTAFYDRKTKWGVNMPVIEDPDPPDTHFVCGCGYHLAKSIPDVFQGTEFPLRLAEAEPLSPILGEDETKIRVAHAKIVRWIPQREWPSWMRKTQKFINSIQKIRFFENHGLIDPKWEVFETQDDVRATIRNAAYTATWDAAMKTANNAAYSTARDAVLRAAGKAARTAVWDANYNAAKANDASLMARLLICDGLDLDPKHLKHARERWAVWTRGYGLYADVDGVFYVYKKL